MNFVYKKDRLSSLTPEELTDIANEAVHPFPPIYTIADFTGDESRVQKLMCRCHGNGEFELIEKQPNEFRRFVRCRLCGVKTAL